MHFAYFEGILGFSVPSNILTDLLGNTYLNEFKCSWFVICDWFVVCGLWFVISIPLVCFCVSRFVACDCPVSGYNRQRFFWSFLFLSLSIKAMSASFPGQKFHSPWQLPLPFSVLFLWAKLGSTRTLWFALRWFHLNDWQNRKTQHPFKVCKAAAWYNEFGSKI